MKTLAETFWEQLAPGGGFPQFMQWKQHLLRTLLAIAWAVIGCAAVAGTPDRSTPLAAAKSYLTAIKEGNAMVMGTGSLGTTNQKQWMFQFMRCYLADQKLETAAVEKFGREATEKSFGEMKRTFQAVPQALAVIDELRRKDGRRSCHNNIQAVAGWRYAGAAQATKSGRRMAGGTGC